MKILSLVFLLMGSICAVQAATPPTPIVTHLAGIPKVELSNLQDLNLLQVSPKATNIVYTRDESVCIYSSAIGHNYSIMIDANDSTQYELQNGAHALPVELWWSTQAAPENSQQLIPNQALRVQNDSGSAEPNCPNGLNANLQIRINSDKLMGIPSGSYSAVFEVIVTPAI